MLSKDFIAGLVCGEGGFSSWKVTIKERSYPVFRFSITLHQVDLPLLNELKQTLKYGTVRKKSSPKDNPVYAEYMITRWQELMKFVDDFGPLLKGYKRQQCYTWYDKLCAYKRSKGKIK